MPYSLDFARRELADAERALATYEEWCERDVTRYGRDYPTSGNLTLRQLAYERAEDWRALVRRFEANERKRQKRYGSARGVKPRLDWFARVLGW